MLFGRIGAGLALAWMVAISPAAVRGQDDEVEKETTLFIKKMTGAEDLHESHEGDHRVIFVDEDGVSTEIHGEGEGFRWMAGPHGKDVTLAFAGMGSGTFLGVGTTELTPELRTHFGVAGDAGVMVSKVIDDSGAFTAGVLVGDIITGVDGEEIASGRDLRQAITSREEGDGVVLEIWRDGKAQQISAILGKNEDQLASAFHAMPHLAGGQFAKAVKIHCDDEDANCNIWMSNGIDACDGDEECEVRVSCDDGDCTCTVNGVETDCEGIEGVHLRHGE
jgi:hypothetical protein